MAVIDLAQERRSLKTRYEELENEVKDLAISAYANEQITRGRVERMEEITKGDLRRRLKWLILGR